MYAGRLLGLQVSYLLYYCSESGGCIAVRLDLVGGESCRATASAGACCVLGATDVSAYPQYNGSGYGVGLNVVAPRRGMRRSCGKEH